MHKMLMEKPRWSEVYQKFCNPRGLTSVQGCQRNSPAFVTSVTNNWLMCNPLVWKFRLALCGSFTHQNHRELLAYLDRLHVDTRTSEVQGQSLDYVKKAHFAGLEFVQFELHKLEEAIIIVISKKDYLVGSLYKGSRL